MFNSTWESSFGAKEVLQFVENQVLPEGMTLVPPYSDDEKGKQVTDLGYRKSQ